jgi:hypothetical protein
MTAYAQELADAGRFSGVIVTANAAGGSMSTAGDLLRF